MSYRDDKDLPERNKASMVMSLKKTGGFEGFGSFGQRSSINMNGVGVDAEEDL